MNQTSHNLAHRDLPNVSKPGRSKLLAVRKMGAYPSPLSKIVCEKTLRKINQLKCRRIGLLDMLSNYFRILRI